MRPVHIAAGLGHVEAVAALLDAGLDVDACGVRAFVAAGIALAAVSPRSAMTVINVPMSLQESNPSALAFAANAGQVEVARLLLARGADKDAVDGTDEVGALSALGMVLQASCTVKYRIELSLRCDGTTPACAICAYRTAQGHSTSPRARAMPGW